MKKSDITENCLLVTGADGRIGRLLRQLWTGRGVIWMGRAEWQMGGPAPDLPAGAQVLHLAGATSGDLGRNAQAARALSAALRPGHRLVLMSSVAVYGPGPGPFAETDPLAPVGDYARAKAEVEAILAPHNPLILRLGNLLGADALTEAAARGPVELDQAEGGAGPVRAWIGPQTLADLVWRLLRAPPGVVNLAQPPALAMAALLQEMGADWSFGTRQAPVPRVEMVLDRLAALCHLPPATPAGLVAELQGLKGIWP